jgi:hypothetical protein
VKKQIEVGPFWYLNVKFKRTLKIEAFSCLSCYFKMYFFRLIVK